MGDLGFVSYPNSVSQTSHFGTFAFRQATIAASFSRRWSASAALKEPNTGEPTGADLDELPARDDHLLAHGQRGQRQGPRDSGREVMFHGTAFRFDRRPSPAGVS